MSSDPAKFPVAPDVGQAAVAPGSGARVVEAGFAVRPRSGKRYRVASEEARFHEGDVLLVRSERGDVLVKALESSTRATLPPEGYLRVVRRLAPAEASSLLARLES